MQNYDMFGKHIKVSDVIERPDIYFIMALRNYFDMVTQKLPQTNWITGLGKSKTQKEKECIGKFHKAPSRDVISLSS